MEGQEEQEEQEEEEEEEEEEAPAMAETLKHRDFQKHRDAEERKRIYWRRKVRWFHTEADKWVPDLRVRGTGRDQLCRLKMSTEKGLRLVRNFL
jgi:hypothetical protein